MQGILIETDNMLTPYKFSWISQQISLFVTLSTLYLRLSWDLKQLFTEFAQQKIKWEGFGGKDGIWGWG